SAVVAALGGVGLMAGLVAGVHPALLAVLPEEHLLGERDLAAEQRPDRLAAMDPLDRLADQRRDRQGRDLAETLARRQRDGVRQDDLAQVRVADSVDRGIAQDAVRGAGI